MSEQRVRARSERRVGAQRPTGSTRKLRLLPPTAHQGFRALLRAPSSTHGRVGSPGDPTATSERHAQVSSGLSPQDSFRWLVPWKARPRVELVQRTERRFSREVILIETLRLVVELFIVEGWVRAVSLRHLVLQELQLLAKLLVTGLGILRIVRRS